MTFFFFFSFRYTYLFKKIMSSAQQGEASGTSGRSSSDLPKHSRGPGKYEKRPYPKKGRYNKNRDTSSTSTGQMNNESSQQRPNGQNHQESSSTSSTPELSRNDAANVPQWFSSYMESVRKKLNNFNFKFT